MSYYNYNYTYSSAPDLGTVIFWGVYLTVYLGVALVLYILRSAGLHAIAKRRCINHPWLAWIPVASEYMLGCVSDQYQYVVKGKNKSRRKVLLALNLLSIALSGVLIADVVRLVANVITGVMYQISEEMLLQTITAPLIALLGICIPASVVSVVTLVFHYIAMYDLYTSCTPQNNVLFLILSIFFRVTEPFFIFCNRKMDGGMPPRRPEPRIEYGAADPEFR